MLQRLFRLADEDDRRVQTWVRISLGGEKMTELAGELGSSDGSGVLRLVQRLQAGAKRDEDLAVRFSRLRAAMAKH